MNKITVAALMLAGLLTAAGSAQAASPVTLTAEETQMLNLVNAERAKAAASPLVADAELTKIARLKSQDMIAKNYFSHTSPTYGDPFQMMKSFGITYRTAGENLAGNQTVAKAHTALMNSAGHRANILNGQFDHIGIGIVHGGQYGMMFTQEFAGGLSVASPVKAPTVAVTAPAPAAKPTPAPAPRPAQKAVRALTAVRVRNSMGPDFKTMQVLYPWWTADLVAQWGDWDLVRLDDGRRGFVPARYVQVINR